MFLGLVSCENPATKARPNCRTVAIALKGDSGWKPILLQLQIACTLRATQPHRIIPLRITAQLAQAPVPKGDMASYNRPN